MQISVPMWKHWNLRRMCRSLSAKVQADYEAGAGEMIPLWHSSFRALVKMPVLPHECRRHNADSYRRIVMFSAAADSETVRLSVVLTAGTEVEKKGQEGDWIQVDYDGQTGYVYSGSASE